MSIRTPGVERIHDPAELREDFTLTAGPALERKGDVASYLTGLEQRSVFFVDEIHRLPRALEETFYPAMEDRRLPITVGQGAGAKVVTLDLPAFTLIGATTRAGLLTTPLRDRFGVSHRLDLYSPQELGRIVRRSPRARAARRGSQTACSSGCATSRRCAAPAPSTRAWRARHSTCSRSTRPASIASTGTSCARSARSSAAVPWACLRLAWPWGRSRTRSRTTTTRPPTPPSSCSTSRAG